MCTFAWQEEQEQQKSSRKASLGYSRRPRTKAGSTVGPSPCFFANNRVPSCLCAGNRWINPRQCRGCAGSQAPPASMVGGSDEMPPGASGHVDEHAEWCPSGHTRPTVRCSGGQGCVPPHIRKERLRPSLTAVLVAQAALPSLVAHTQSAHARGSVVHVPMKPQSGTRRRASATAHDRRRHGASKFSRKP